MNKNNFEEQKFISSKLKILILCLKFLYDNYNYFVV